MAKHYATFRHPKTTYVVRFEGKEVARTRSAVILEEHYGERQAPDVVYLPADALSVSRDATDRRTHCPLKGDATYWTILGVEDAAWSYESPFEAVAPIAGHLAFYDSKGFTVEAL